VIVMTVHQLLWLQTAPAPANQMKWRHLIGDLNSYVRFVDLKRSLACDLPALTRSFKWSESHTFVGIVAWSKLHSFHPGEHGPSSFLLSSGPRLRASPFVFGWNDRANWRRKRDNQR
jgi:hypothetical protein